MPNPNNNRNNKQSPQGGPPKRNNAALISVALWTLAISLIVQYAVGQRQQSSSVEVEYGVFRQMIVEGKVSEVEMSSDKYVIYTKVDAQGNYAEPGKDPVGELTDPALELEEAQAALDALVAATPPPITDEAAKQELSSKQEAAALKVQELKSKHAAAPTYFCAPLNDDGLIELLEEYGIRRYGSHYQAPLSPIIDMLITIVLPTLLMVGLFALLMRGMASRMGAA